MDYDRIVLPIKVKSRNVLDRMHWAEKKKLKDQYALVIRSSMNLLSHKPVESGSVFSKLEITCYLRRLMDYDNVVGGCKQLIDALCDAGFIWDDSTKYIKKLEVKQFQIPKKQEAYTVVKRWDDTK